MTIMIEERFSAYLDDCSVLKAGHCSDDSDFVFKEGNERFRSLIPLIRELVYFVLMVPCGPQ